MRFLPKKLAISMLLTVFVAGPGAQELARKTPPVVVREVKADYTKEARDARIEGIVRVDAVVLKDGSVGDVTVTKSLDQKYGLDEQAVNQSNSGNSSQERRTENPLMCSCRLRWVFTLSRRIHLRQMNSPNTPDTGHQARRRLQNAEYGVVGNGEIDSGCRAAQSIGCVVSR